MKQTHLKTIALAVLFSSNCFAATNTLHDKTEKTSPTVNDETYIWDVTDSTLKKSRTGSLPISTATQSALDGKANASAFSSQSAFTSAWGWTPGGGVSAWSDIQALLTGTGTYVKADGTTGDPTGTITTGTGVAAAMANALDGTGGLASKASLDALPNIVFGNGIAVAENIPSTGTDTVSIDADATPTDGSAKPLTSGGAYTALAGKQATLVSGTSIKTVNNTSLLGSGNIDISGGGSFTFDTFPTYEDSAHSSGIAVNGTTLAVYSSTTGKWLTVGLTDTLDATPVTYAATLTITDTSATGDTFTLNSIAYDAADSPVSVTNLPTATEQITYTGSNTAACTGDVTGTGPWTINAYPATVACSVSSPGVAVLYDFEETGTPSGLTVVGTVDFDATGINGQSAYINAATSTSSFYRSVTHTSGMKLWNRMKIKFSHLPTGSTTTLNFATCGNTIAKNYIRVINVNYVSYFGVQSAGGSEVVGTTPLSNDTEYTVDFACSEGTGANAYTALDFSTSGVPAHSGTNFIESTNGTNTSLLNMVTYLGTYYNSIGYLGIYFDDIGESWEE